MAELAVGDVLEGRYRIDHPIARGGMSTVYRCVDLRLGRAVAAKIMHDRFADDAATRGRFRREARAMAQLSHPNLVGVYDFSSDEGISFLIMELITGGTLRELVAERGPMPPHAATAVMRAVLTGLSVAHSQGLVHRDIKPDNILINGDNRVKVADFGLVRVSSASEHSTNEIVGTAAYLSPEQVDGSEITPASDVYSAGIVLFDLLTGTVPFTGETPLAKAYQRITHDVPSPSSRIDGIPQLFDELVATATARSPEDRFADAGEFLAALDDVAAELNLPAYSVPVPTNSAAHRAAAVPTDTTGIIETTNLGAVTGPEPENETSVLRPENETRALGAVPPPPVRPAPAPLPAPIPAPEQDNRPVAQRPDEPAPVSNRSGWRLWLGIAVAAIVLTAVLLGGWWFGSGRYGEIPQVVGMDRAAAISTVTEAGFETTTEIVYDDDVPADQSAGTDPAGGSNLLPGEMVTVLISQGRPSVPEIPAGMGVEDYRALAGERTFEVATGESVYSADVPSGAVAETTPPPGTTLDTGSTVTVHLSKGPEPVEVPTLTGTDLDEARAILEGSGLVIGEVTPRFDKDVPGDALITTTPGPGATLTRGDRIDLVVSTAVAVPDVTGMTLVDAKAALQDAGFSVADTRDPALVGESEDTVVALEPSAGTLTDPERDRDVIVVLPGQITVPDVTGMTVREARSTLRGVGLDINASVFANSQVISGQSPAAGTPLRRDEDVRVQSR
ncbi:Stk1 family PASTA domain-containing Ser/Thr kinase [Corynebacterium doosanense]|uniref:non-specific serine/threonine protein kinase n=1 Tax=Corynebacterium doosanense CAU 212 = DSM 45436 TaxID=558173 RepID=A0A097IH60_9CORY|nr:Stk1 family PASTA domain-containing Ser/Thr kinase [Corynebacterium doosanense]AIT61475.1 serine/threonine protein kinase [Corynebacterium doosanense CAU 212 = DSM 45436]